ncbi:hypothetical protein KKE06_02200 [Candidatus Micrarchaeota archaeon]|nr:hypothetical protein [Candidatus Micrarchaeota archaeon]
MPAKKPETPKRKSPREVQKQRTEANLQMRLMCAFEPRVVNPLINRIRRENPTWTNEQVLNAVWEQLRPKRKLPVKK